MFSHSVPFLPPLPYFHNMTKVINTTILFVLLGILSSLCCNLRKKKTFSTNTEEYLYLSAAEKLHHLWIKCRANTTSTSWPSLPNKLWKLLISQSMCPSLTIQGDIIPIVDGDLRFKTIHTQGAVGRVTWRNLGGHSYTGIFQGAQHGLVRLGLSSEPFLKISPGMGLKFLRNGMDSANVLAMYSVSGQWSWNFFKNDLSNHLPAISLFDLPLALKGRVKKTKFFISSTPPPLVLYIGVKNNSDMILA